MSAEGLSLPTSGPVDVPVAVASGGAAWEIGLIPLIETHRSGLHLARRCVDLADLLAVARAGLVRVAVVDADLARLDRDHVAALRADGVAVLVVETATSAGRCLQLGASDVVTADTAARDVATLVRSLADRTGQPSVPPSPSSPSLDLVPAGALVAVWGPSGAPGRSTVALNLATEAALAGVASLLVDADTAGGALSTRLGVLDEAPGLAAACRSATRGRLDPSMLAAHALTVADGLRVLTGASRADRWRELRPSALETVWQVARRVAQLVVVDLGSTMAAPEQNGSGGMSADVGASVVADADILVVVGTPDPLGMLRLVQALDQLDDTATRTLVVVNRMRDRVVGRRAERQVRDALARFAGDLEVCLLPDDPAATDEAMRTGSPLSVAAPSSSLRAGIVDLLAQVHPPAASAAGVRAWRTRRARRPASVPLGR